MNPWDRSSAGMRRIYLDYARAYVRDARFMRRTNSATPQHIAEVLGWAADARREALKP